MNSRTAERNASHASLTFARVLASVLLMSLLPLQAARADPTADRVNERHSPVGTWLGTIVRPAPLPTILGLETFFADGNTLDESNSTTIRSLGHGRWQRSGHDTFTRSALNFVFDASRNFTGSTYRTQTFQLSRDGQTMVVLEGVALRYDTAGTLLSTTPDVPGSVTYRRVFSNQ